MALSPEGTSRDPVLAHPQVFGIHKRPVTPCHPPIVPDMPAIAGLCPLPLKTKLWVTMGSSEAEGRGAGLWLASRRVSCWLGELFACAAAASPGMAQTSGCQLTSEERWWFVRAEGLLLLKVGFQHHTEMLKSPRFPSLCSRKQVPYFIHWLVWLWRESCPYFGYSVVC